MAQVDPVTENDMQRELDGIHKELSSFSSKLDSVLTTLREDTERRVSKLEQGHVGLESLLTRVENQLGALHQDLFGDKGLSVRLRGTEQKLIHHGVWVKIVAAAAAAIVVAGVNHVLFGREPPSSSTAAAATIGGR